MGITGSGKSYQWLKLAEALLPTGAVFRCLDTDDAITYMLETQFPHLKPENKGNVYVWSASDWESLKAGTDQILKQSIKDNDWLVIDMADAPWDSVQRYFTSEVFKTGIGEYFLQVRKEIEASKKKVASVAREALSGWTDWAVINKLYTDWITPLIYRLKCHLYLATKVQELGSKEDADIKELYSELGVRPSGQKHLGHQVHTILLFIPGRGNWFITTCKDRAGRPYFKRTPLLSLYMQYFVAKANWPLITPGATV